MNSSLFINENDISYETASSYNLERETSLIDILNLSNDLDKKLKNVINFIDNIEFCPFCYKSAYDHKISKYYCDNSQYDKCVRCFFDGHRSNQCLYKINTSGKACYFCLIPSYVNDYLKENNSNNNHNESYGKCDIKRRDIVKSLISLIYKNLLNNLEIKLKFNEQVFDFGNDSKNQYINQAYKFYKGTNLINGILFIDWSITNKLI